MSRLAEIVAKRDAAARLHQHYRDAALRLLRARAPAHITAAHRDREVSARAELALREKALEHHKQKFRGTILDGDNGAS
jgi:hypothetical protein